MDSNIKYLKEELKAKDLKIAELEAYIEGQNEIIEEQSIIIRENNLGNEVN